MIVPKWLGLSLVLLATGCVAPAIKVDQLAAKFGFSRSELQGEGFTHIIYLNQPARQAPKQLHVYLEGDGDPWLNRRIIAPDPTPRDPLMLRLMSLDTSAALYLGRPCYHGLAAKEPCHPRLWTTHRYSPAVVDSMAAALQHSMAYQNTDTVVLIGHSGGGTLAMLLAPQLEKTQTVLTLAANLDTTAWTQHHNYSPLYGSLNPAQALPLPDHIRQIHLLAAQDKNTPPALFPQSLLQQSQVCVVKITTYRHNCCWFDQWLQWLKLIDQNSPC